jgi:3-dehydroquinate dehydratase
VAGENVAQAIDIARQSERYADVIEIRLDTLADPGISLFMKEFHVPLLFTNRPDWEGGFFKGSEARRIELLVQAVQHDCALVDLELKTAPELRGELLDILLQHPKTGLIISWHDFSGTPASEELGEILQQQMESGALQHPKTGLIISWHDFSGTPASEELGEILQQQMESGAHIGKIVTTAKIISPSSLFAWEPLAR